MLYANTVHLTNHYKVRLNRLFQCGKCASKFVQKEQQEESGNDKREVGWDSLRKIRDEMISSLARSSIHALTASGTQDKDAREEGREVRAQKATCPDAVNHERIGTTPEPANLCQQHPWDRKSICTQNVTLWMKCTHSLFRVRQVQPQTIKTKASCCHHHAASQYRARQQTHSKQERPQTIHLLSCCIRKEDS